MIVVSMLRGVLGALLTLAPFAFVFALPWVDIGIWRDTETVTVALHFISGLSAAAITAMALLGSRRAVAALLQPVTLSFAALAGLTVLQAMFSPVSGFDPARTLHGLLGHGLGGLWFLDCFALCAGYLVSGRGRWRMLHAMSACSATVLAVILTFSEGNSWTSDAMTGWLGPVAFLASVTMFARRQRALVLGGAAILATGSLVSPSPSTWLAIIVATFAVGVFAGKTMALPHHRFRATILTATILLLAGIPAALSLLVEPLEAVAASNVSGVTMSIDGIPSRDPRDHISIDAQSYGSLWEKARGARALLQNLLRHPEYLAFGRGWGSLPDIMAEELRSLPGRRFETATETSSRTLWPESRPNTTYSRNLELEALASLGVSGVVITSLLLLGPLLWARPQQLTPAAFLVLGFAIIASSSPLRNSIAPFLALAFASVVRLDPSTGASPRRAPAAAVAAAGTAVASLALIYFAAIMLGVANFEYRTRLSLPQQFLQLDVCQPVRGHLAPAHEINASMFRRFVDQGESEPAPFAWFTRRLMGTVNYSCIMRELAEHGAGAAFLVSSLELRYRLLQSSGNFPPILSALDTEVRHWGEDIAHLLKVAPGRTELIIPYVNWLIAKGDKDASLAAISTMLGLAPAPTDPVRAWLKARRAELAGNESDYRSQMAIALRTGIANLIPMRRSETDDLVRKGMAVR